MSRKKQNLRAFLHQVKSPTIEQAWGAAWRGAQKRYHSKTMNSYKRQITQLQSELKAVKEKYHDLLYQVASKFPDETRHETAKRYIRQAENTESNAEAASTPPEQGE